MPLPRTGYLSVRPEQQLCRFGQEVKRISSGWPLTNGIYHPEADRCRSLGAEDPDCGASTNVRAAMIYGAGNPLGV